MPVTVEATVKVHVGGRRIIATAEGNGPVNALDSALRSAVAEQYPELNDVELVDYKVRILAGHAGTDSITRVLVSVRSGRPRPQEWTTVGVHANVVEASWQALVDALVYVLPSPTGAPRPADLTPKGTPRCDWPESPIPTAWPSWPSTARTARQRAREIADHPFGIAGLHRHARGRWPTSGCSRRSCRPRSWPSAGTTRPRRRTGQSGADQRRCMFIKPSTA